MDLGVPIAARKRDIMGGIMLQHSMCGGCNMNFTLCPLVSDATRFIPKCTNNANLRCGHAPFGIQRINPQMHNKIIHGISHE